MASSFNNVAAKTELSTAAYNRSEARAVLYGRILSAALVGFENGHGVCPPVQNRSVNEYHLAVVPDALQSVLVAGLLSE